MHVSARAADLGDDRGELRGGLVTESDKKSLGRNDPCHCGSGKKYKACHLGQDEAAEREQRAKQQEAQAKDAPAPAEGAEADAAAAAAAERSHSREPRHATPQPWKRASTGGSRTMPRFSAPRRSGGS
jgi:hypothetical protein